MTCHNDHPAVVKKKLRNSEYQSPEPETLHERH